MAPADVESGPAHFRFHRIAEYAGRWTKASREPDGATEVCAVLTAGAAGEDEWHFRTDSARLPLRSLPGARWADMSDTATTELDGVRCPLLDETMIWDQLIILIQHRWQSEFPPGSWQVAAVSFDAWPPAPARAGAILSAHITKRRRRALEVTLGIDGRPIGTSLFSVTIGQDRGT